MAVNYTVAEALKICYAKEAEAAAERKHIIDMINGVEEYVKTLDENTINNLKSYGIDISSLVNVDFDMLREDRAMQKDFTEVMGSLKDKLVKFVVEHEAS